MTPVLYGRGYFLLSLVCKIKRTSAEESIVKPSLLESVSSYNVMFLLLLACMGNSAPIEIKNLYVLQIVLGQSKI